MGRTASKTVRSGHPNNTTVSSYCLRGRSADRVEEHWERPTRLSSIDHESVSAESNQSRSCRRQATRRPGSTSPRITLSTFSWNSSVCSFNQNLYFANFMSGEAMLAFGLFQPDKSGGLGRVHQFAAGCQQPVEVLQLAYALGFFHGDGDFAAEVQTQRRLRHASEGRDAPVDDGQLAVRQQAAEVALTEHPHVHSLRLLGLQQSLRTLPSREATVVELSKLAETLRETVLRFQV